MSRHQGFFLRRVLTLAAALLPLLASGADRDAEVSDQEIKTFFRSGHMLKCAVGQAAQMQGDHETALWIFSTCASENNLYGIMSLALYHDWVWAWSAAMSELLRFIVRRHCTPAARGMARTANTITRWPCCRGGACRRMQKLGCIGCEKRPVSGRPMPRNFSRPEAFLE